MIFTVGQQHKKPMYIFLHPGLLVAIVFQVTVVLQQLPPGSFIGIAGHKLNAWSLIAKATFILYVCVKFTVFYTDLYTEYIRHSTSISIWQ